MNHSKLFTPVSAFLFLCTITAVMAATLPSGKLHVKVIEVETNNPIQECLVEIKDERGNLVDKTRTDASGAATFNIPYGFYNLTFTHELYDSGGKNGYELKQPEQHLVKWLYESTVALFNIEEAVALLKRGQITECRSIVVAQIANGTDKGGVMTNLLKRTNFMEHLEARMLSPEVEAIFNRQMSNKSMGNIYFPLKAGGKLNQELYPDIYELTENADILDFSNEVLVGKLLEIHRSRK